jgi:hypothetical protein
MHTGVTSETSSEVLRPGWDCSFQSCEDRMEIMTMMMSRRCKSGGAAGEGGLRLRRTLSLRFMTNNERMMYSPVLFKR